MQVGQDLFRKPADVGDLVGLADSPLRIYEIGDPQGEVGALIVGGSGDLVCGAGVSLDVGQKPIVEVFRLSEDFVLFGSVERRAQDDAIGGRKVSGPVTQALALTSSTGSRRLWIPPEQNPVSLLIDQRHLLPILIRETEPGRLRAFLEHGREPTGAARPAGWLFVEGNAGAPSEPL